MNKETNTIEKGAIEIYRGADNSIELKVAFQDETVYLTQNQMAELFGKDVRTINEHIKNIYDSGELDRLSTIRNFRIVRQEGTRMVNRTIQYYNLDMIISVGYRVNSIRGTQFRQWATKRLRDYLVQGYAVNEKRLQQKNQEIEELKTGIRIISRAMEQLEHDKNNEVFTTFANGLALLDAYDHEALDNTGASTKQAVYPDYTEYMEMIRKMYADFASDVFAQPKDNSFESSIAQIAQSFSGQELYPSIEEKAANLLYFICKNHSFVDGNKRIAAACFLHFLQKNNCLLQENGEPVIGNNTLASLTLFIANSKPNEAESVKRLVISILNRGRET